jgi:hypothetical protein
MVQYIEQHGFMTYQLQNKAVADLPPINDILRTETSIVVMRDTQLEKRGKHARAQLRSIPFFDELGINTVVHADVYNNDFKLIDYTYHSSEDVSDQMSQIEFPLIHIATKEGIKEHGEEHLIHDLLNRSVEDRGQYILITDTTAPRLPTFMPKPGRSIVDDYGVAIKDYETLTTRYLTNYVDSALPASVTRNLHYHRASEYHRQQDAPANTLENIFDYTRAPSGSPVWEPLHYFIKHDLENILDNYSERIRDSLRSWTEHGETQKIANQMIDALRICDYDADQLEEYQSTDPTFR